MSILTHNHPAKKGSTHICTPCKSVFFSNTWIYKVKWGGLIKGCAISKRTEHCLQHGSYKHPAGTKTTRRRHHNQDCWDTPSALRSKTILQTPLSIYQNLDKNQYANFLKKKSNNYSKHSGSEGWSHKREGRYHEVGQAISSLVHPIDFSYVAAGNCANESLNWKIFQLLLQLLVSVLISPQQPPHHHRAFHRILWHVQRLP